MPAPGCSEHDGKYVGGCSGCKAVARTVSARVRAKKAAGKFRPRVPAEVVRAHIAKLHTAMTYVEIAAAAGLHRHTVTYIASPKSRWRTCSGDTAHAIMQIQPRDQNGPRLPRSNHVPTTGATRRLRALHRKGHSLRGIARELDMNLHTIRSICTGRTPTIRRTTHEAIDELFNDWQHIAGDQHIAARAAARGFHGPDAWEDIDDPSCKPGQSARRRPDELNWTTVRHALAGASTWDELTRAERYEVVTRLAVRLPDVGIAELLHATKSNIGQFRNRMQIPPAGEAALDRWHQEQRQRKRYTAPAGEVRRRYDLQEAAA